MGEVFFCPIPLRGPTSCAGVPRYSLFLCPCAREKMVIKTAWRGVARAASFCFCARLRQVEWYCRITGQGWSAI